LFKVFTKFISIHSAFCRVQAASISTPSVC
jgi:hypothetical protein